MALKITCPHCSAPRRLDQPYPLPGSEVQCLECGHPLSISYPSGMVDRLRARGIRFVDDAEPMPVAPVPAPAPRPAPPVPRPPIAPPTRDAARTRPDPTPRRPDDTQAMPPQPAAPPPAAPRRRPPQRTAPTVPRPPIAGPLTPGPAASGAGTGRPGVAGPAASSRGRPVQPARGAAPPPAPPAKKRSLIGRLFRATVALTLLAGLAGAGTLGFAFWHFEKEVPSVATLETYRPPSVTEVYDHKGKLLGEIYENRRYVRELDTMPQHLKDAFIAAEDANFYTHGGVDYEGILRAIGRNLAKGRKAQGASTITMQVARNFLLTRDKTYERKIKEIILSHRIEDTFDKEHILYLYLNEIYLGSGAYGVESAARTYFDKHVDELTLAESAIIAGLPPAPSRYSPHRNWELARERQEYVLGQMLSKGKIDQARYDAAMAERVRIIKTDNEFLKQAPYFTEHVRRYLVETYGFDKIYNDGLRVETTADLELQKIAQGAVIDGVHTADNRVGWRGIEQTLAPGDIKGHLSAQEAALTKAEGDRILYVADASNGGGHDAPPSRSTLEAGERYEAVVLEAADKHAVVGIGAHRALIPLSWTKWAYPPNPERSWKYRGQNKMSNALKKGDVVQVTLEAASSEEIKNLKGYDKAGPGPFAAARLYQAPALQGAMFSYRLSDGAVVAMVGGVDFEDSEYNRATQARRQVGSTFKPIVYAAAIGTRQFTAASMVQDAPTVFQTLGDKLWKPGNYGGKYLGNITLRRALQMSRNVCTVRVLDKIGLDPVFQLAGPALRIGYNEPSCSRTHQKAGQDCVGERSPSNVSGYEWCEYCDPESCPLVKADQEVVRKDGQDITVGEAKECLGTPTTESDGRWCTSCDVNLRVCDWLPIERIPDTDPCVDARKDDKGRMMCRTCDLSMGLGSSSLTMVELARAYSVFATYGTFVEPHYINRVVERDGTVIEEWTPPSAGWPEVMDPAVAGVAHWLLRNVATGGTAAKTNRLGVQVAGKTGTTNDFFDAWFVGYDPEFITAAWVGYDQPRSIGVSFTGGQTALPIWMDFMKVAAPREAKRRFREIPGVQWVSIDESTGRAAIGGLPMPMLPGTGPDNVAVEIGQKTTEDILTSDF
jgi:penicillin-binding protein 1A